MNSVRLGEIVAALGGELRGDPAHLIARIAPLETAGGDAITFVAQARLQKALEASAAGVIVVDIEMPKLGELNGQVGFPVALYEAYDDMVAYLRLTGTGVTIEAMVTQIASPDVKGTYEGLVLPRKLPAPDGSLVDAKPLYDHASNVARPALQALYARTFASNRLDAIAFPTTPRVAIASNPESSSLENFGLFIQNTDPGSNAGIPGIQIPIALGATSKLPIGLELDGPAGSDERLLAIGIALDSVFGRLPPPR